MPRQKNYHKKKRRDAYHSASDCNKLTAFGHTSESVCKHERRQNVQQQRSTLDTVGASVEKVCFKSRGQVRRRSQRSKRSVTCSSTLSVQSTDTSSSTSTVHANALEIPGFYYDEEKKKYFKILPGHKNTHAGAVTKETIKRKEQEQARKHDIKLLYNVNTSQLTDKDISSARNRQNYCTNLFHIVRNHSYGFSSVKKYQSDVHNLYQTNLKPHCKSKIVKSRAGSYDRLEHMLNMYSSQTFDNQLVCLWNVKDLLVQRIQTVSLNGITCNSNEATLDITLTGAMIPKAVSKITGMCCATVPCGTDVKEYILYTTMHVIGNNPGMAMLRNLHCSSALDFRHSEFNLGSMATWCCAWNPVTTQFSIGAEKHGLLLDVETRRLWEFNTQKSDVLAQAFSHSGRVLYNGCKKGVIFAHDARSASTTAAYSLSHKDGVCSVRVSTDDNYVYAADFGNRIQKWDVRQRKVVTSYHGHRNEYSLLPIHINEQENLLYAVAQDCYTRLWDLQSGVLIKKVPPPYEASFDTIPAVHYASNMTHKGARPGLFMGIKDELHFYSL